VANDDKAVFKGPFWKGFPYVDEVRRLEGHEPWLWLAAGWRDMKAAPAISLFFGLLLAGLSAFFTVGLYLLDQTWAIAPALGGFLIVGPILSVGMYALSRELEAGRTPGFFDVVFSWRRNPLNIFGGGVLLTLYFIIWMRGAALIFAVLFPYKGGTIQGLVNATLFTPEGWLFLAVGVPVGAAFAFVAFVFSCVSLQIMLDRRVDVFQGAMASLVCVAGNFRTMMVWAAVIVGLTAAGFATGFLGFLVILPLVGHASWHAYRALLGRRETA